MQNEYTYFVCSMSKMVGCILGFDNAHIICVESIFLRLAGMQSAGLHTRATHMCNGLSIECVNDINVPPHGFRSSGQCRL